MYGPIYFDSDSSLIINSGIEQNSNHRWHDASAILYLSTSGGIPYVNLESDINWPLYWQPIASVCLSSSTLIRMSNFVKKSISNVVVGDSVLSCCNANISHIVKRVVCFDFSGRVNLIPKGIIGNSDDIICTEHPIWCNNGKIEYILLK